MRIYLFAVLLLITSNTWAQENTSTSSVSLSRTNRQVKTFSLGVRPLEAGEYSMAESSLLIGFYLHPNLVLELQGGASWEKPRSSYFGQNTKSWHAGVYLRKFVGNSFNVRAGVKYTDFEYERTFSYDDGYNLKGERLSGIAAIGNQWQWNDFYFGVDWLSLNLPIATTIRDEGYKGYPYEHSLASVKGSFADTKYISILTLNMGMSF